MAVKRYIVRTLIAFDQWVNALLGGYPDETLSSRMGKKIAANRNCHLCIVICRLLNYVDPEHCVDAIEYDEGRKRESERLKHGKTD